MLELYANVSAVSIVAATIVTHTVSASSLDSVMLMVSDCVSSMVLAIYYEVAEPRLVEGYICVDSECRSLRLSSKFEVLI